VAKWGEEEEKKKGGTGCDCLKQNQERYRWHWDVASQWLKPPAEGVFNIL